MGNKFVPLTVTQINASQASRKYRKWHVASKWYYQIYSTENNFSAKMFSFCDRNKRFSFNEKKANKARLVR
jgi:hypothetical protein